MYCLKSEVKRLRLPESNLISNQTHLGLIIEVFGESVKSKQPFV